MVSDLIEMSNYLLMIPPLSQDLHSHIHAEVNTLRKAEVRGKKSTGYKPNKLEHIEEEKYDGRNSNIMSFCRNYRY